MPRKHTPPVDIEQLDTDSPTSRRALKEYLRRTQKLLVDIQSKVLSSAALNGGFDSLMFKIENIERTQSNMSDQIKMIHEVLYKPDDGFFARVKQVETEASIVHSHTETVNTLDVSVKDLKRWKNLVNRVMKWFAVAVGGGVITLVGKLLYDFVSGHIKIV